MGEKLPMWAQHRTESTVFTLLKRRWKIHLEIFCRYPKRFKLLGPELAYSMPWTPAGNSFKEDVPYTLSYTASVESKAQVSALWPIEGQVTTSSWSRWTLMTQVIYYWSGIRSDDR